MAVRVIGLGFDGSTVTITIGKKEIRCIKAAYGDNIDPAWLAYMGEQENSEQTPGGYKTDNAKITMSSVVARADFFPLFPQSGGNLIRFPIVVGRTHPDIGSDSDMLSTCRWIKGAASVENSNKAEEVEFEFTVRQVLWTAKRISINARGKLAVVGTSAL